ncbi:MAG: hypothetical protein WCY51_08315, partial [Sulfurimonas sp.]
IKALIILNEGATGIRQLPSYCTVWVTEEFLANDVLEYIVDTDAKKLMPKKRVKSPKMIEAHSLKLYPFRYYNTISWITKTINSNKHLLDMNFLMSEKIQRYHDLYNKFYVGFIDVAEVRDMLELDESYKDDHRVIVAIEKKHSDEIVLTYYIQLTRKKLYLFSFDEDKVVKEKKDPYGITVTEVYHISKMMDEKYRLTIENLDMINKLLRDKFQSFTS